MPTAKPAPIVRLQGFDYDDEPTFTTPTSEYLRNPAGTFTFRGQTLPQSERQPLADAIQGCFDADFSTSVDPNGFTINGGAFAVVPILDSAGETMTGVEIGAHVYTLGAASSLQLACLADLALQSLGV